LNPLSGMTPWSLHTKKLDTEAPARREFMIAIVTIYAIVVSILACELVSRVHATETKSSYSRLRTHDV
jgi:putative exporter of polyketide antibiotics